MQAVRVNIGEETAKTLIQDSDPFLNSFGQL